MGQKLFVIKHLGEGEVDFPIELQELLAEGWKIAQISAYGYGYATNYALNHKQDQCLLLLQRE